MSTKRPADDATQWLLDGDPAIRWQVLRDLVGASKRAVDKQRASVASDGWGARLLAKQDANAMWAGGLYTPKWTSTTYTMLLLRDFGLVPSNEQARNACMVLLDGGLQDDGGIAYGWSRGEMCVTGMVLSILSYFRIDDPRLDALADFLLEREMPDGGWNCRRDATHSSLNTTISVLEGLRLLELHRRAGTRELRDAQHRGREFLLAHRLFRSHRTGKVIKSEFTRLVFPPRWHYDILRALDHFRAVGAPRDARLAEAVELVRGRQREDGRWPLEYAHKGKTFFELERVGRPSRWNTLRALRVLKWWRGD